MKKLFVTLLLVVSAETTHAQGTVIFNQTSPITHAPELGGAPLTGSEAFAQFYLGPSGGSALTPFGNVLTFGTGNRAGYINITPPTTVLPGVSPGSLAIIQVRAWRAVDGPSYEAASLTPNAYVRESLRLTFATGGVPDPVTGVPSSPSPINWPGFSLHAVPEPSSIVLGVVGLGILLFVRRRK